MQRAARDLAIEELELPELFPGGAIAEVEANGICGSDFEQYVGHFDGTGIMRYPLVIGHEPLVRIQEVSPEAAERWQVAEGDRVAVEPHAGCGVCTYCMSGRQVLCPRKIQYGYVSLDVGSGLWGGLAEHMVLSGNTVLHKMPEDVSAEDALMFNPLSAGFEWGVLKGGIGIGDDVLIIGAGQRGLACVIAASMAGADRIMISGLEGDRDKLELAKALGATDTFITDPAEPTSLLDQTGTKVADKVIDVVPAATRPVLDAIQAVRVGGRVVLGGLKGARTVPDFVSDDLILKSIEVVGALGVSSRGYQLAIKAILSGRYDFAPWHTHTVSFADAEDGIKILGGEITTGAAPIHVSVVNK
ncbi:zinc-binding dehydrogenase [Microbacterium aoyamense]|uniref:Zinc-binding dehydrogenase n=1 Tax=Microbacterium aoyamense TaxID=344166 RepID=A0ABN2PVU5_9MICO|nr:zinc-binding dehydrogenase [Microbacterium aoyamense]